MDEIDQTAGNAEGVCRAAESAENAEAVTLTLSLRLSAGRANAR
jgi:hypothetical protein